MRLETGVWQALQRLRTASLEAGQREFASFRVDREVIALAAQVRALIVDTASKGEEFLIWRSGDLDRIGQDLGLSPLHALTQEKQARSTLASHTIESWDVQRMLNTAAESYLSKDLGALVRDSYPGLANLWAGPVPSRLHPTDCTTLDAQSRALGQTATLVLFGKIQPFTVRSDTKFVVRPGDYAHLEQRRSAALEYEDRSEYLAGALSVGVWNRLDFHSVSSLECDSRQCLTVPTVDRIIDQDLSTRGLT